MARKNVTLAVHAFMADRDHSEKTISARGAVLYSYAEPIGVKVGPVVFLQRKLPGNFTITTAQHISGAWEVCGAGWVVGVSDLERATRDPDLLAVAGDVAQERGTVAAERFVEQALTKAKAGAA